MRVLVIGAGQVGSSIAASLSDDNDVVVIDVDGDRVEQLTYAHDVLAIQGDGTAIADLERADAGAADLVIASTDDDETNLVAASTAKILGDAFTIARVRTTRFLDSWRRSTGAFGVDFMVCTNLLTAEAIVRMAGLPAAIDVEAFAHGAVQMAEFAVPASSPIADVTVREADRYDSLTFAAVIGEEVVIPTGDTVIAPGDEVVVIGAPASVRAFANEVAPDADRARDVTVIGGGAIGTETARLLADRGIDPTIIDNDPDRARDLAERLPDSLVLCHDATDVDFLLREHVDKDDLVVVALDADERTLLVSLLAKQIGTGRTVAVVETAEYVRLFEAVGVDVAVNPRDVTAEEITRFTHDRRAENVAIIDSDRAEVIEVAVTGDSVLVGRPIREAVHELPGDVVIGAITRGGEFVMPRGDTVIEPNDHVVVFVETPADDVIEAL